MLTATVLGLAEWGAPNTEAMHIPFVHRTPKLLERLERRVMRRGHHIARSCDEELHALRKALKKLRYSIEFLPPVYRDKQAKAYLRVIKKLLKHLGSLNDAVVVVALAERLGGDLPFKRKLRCVGADDDQAMLVVFLRPGADIGMRPEPIDAGVGPELHQDDLLTQVCRSQWRGIDPLGRTGERRHLAFDGQTGRFHACGLCPGRSALTELDCCDSPRGEAVKPAPPVLDPFGCLDGMHREFFSFILSIVKVDRNVPPSSAAAQRKPVSSEKPRDHALSTSMTACAKASGASCGRL
jgi:CHAD domain